MSAKMAFGRVIILVLLVLVVVTTVVKVTEVHQHDAKLYALHGKIDHLIQHHNPRDRKIIKQHVSNHSHHVNKEKSQVLLMTYMRGGSSLLGEMFNQNPEAVYWFEPFDGVFSQLYGSRHGWFPIDLLYDNNRLRLFTEFESEAMMKLVTDLVNCNIHALPTDAIAGWATTRIVQKRFTTYSDCLISANKGEEETAKKYTNEKGRLIPPWECQGKLVKFSPRKFSVDKVLLSSFYCLHVHKVSPYHDMNITLYLDGKMYVPNCEANAEVYKGYVDCMDNYRKAISGCIPILEDVCRSSSLVGIKGIRLRADLVQRMLIENSDLKLVYQVRDPRAIVSSRRSTGLLSVLSEKDIVKEGELLCQRMTYDLSILYNIEREFPGRVLKVKYEDLVMFPEETTHLFYEFIEMSIPEEVSSYITKSVTSSDQGNAYSTHRKNGTQIVSKWRHQLKLEDIKAIDLACSDILEHYSYPMSEDYS